MGICGCIVQGFDETTTFRYDINSDVNQRANEMFKQIHQEIEEAREDDYEDDEDEGDDVCASDPDLPECQFVPEDATIL